MSLLELEAFFILFSPKFVQNNRVLMSVFVYTNFLLFSLGKKMGVQRDWQKSFKMFLHNCKNRRLSCLRACAIIFTLLEYIVLLKCIFYSYSLTARIERVLVQIHTLSLCFATGFPGPTWNASLAFIPTRFEFWPVFLNDRLKVKRKREKRKKCSSGCISTITNC